MCHPDFEIKDGGSEIVSQKTSKSIKDLEKIGEKEIYINYNDSDNEYEEEEDEGMEIKKNQTFINTDLINNNNKYDNSYYLEIFWIDEKIFNSENQMYFEIMKQNYPNIKINLFDNLEEGFNNILNLEFVTIFVIVSGKLYSQYYYKLKNNLNIIKCIPINIIFTSEKFKKILENEEPDNEQIISYDIQKSINNSFYNLKGHIILLMKVYLLLII